MERREHTRSSLEHHRTALGGFWGRKYARRWASIWTCRWRLLLGRAGGDHIWKSLFPSWPIRPIRRFGTQVVRGSRFLSIQLASADAQRRQRTQKRRRARARFRDPNWWEGGHKALHKRSRATASGQSAAPYMLWPRVWLWGGAGHCSFKKIGPPSTYPLTSYMYGVGQKIRFFSMSSCLPGESRALPAALAVFLSRPCCRNGASRKHPVQLTCPRSVGWSSP